MSASEPAPYAWFDGQLATGIIDRTDDAAALESAGWWAVLATFEGALTCVRFADVRPAPLPWATWGGLPAARWESSLSEDAYRGAVGAIRGRIATGEVYQVNLCRVLSTPFAGADLTGLAGVLGRGNPAPYSGVLAATGAMVVSASPELFLERNGDVVVSRPIKGTGTTAGDLLDKDTAENIMIVDLVRNDLGRVALTGSVTVPELLAVQQHPGLVHLVSTVSARLAHGAGWPELLAAAFPPGSVSGAPKSSALRVIGELEPVARGPYCGALGYVDADRGVGRLGVSIRTFWLDGGRLCFGTGAGITWGSDPAGEWAETQLKARRLLALATGPSAGRGADGHLDRRGPA